MAWSTFFSKRPNGKNAVNTPLGVDGGVAEPIIILSTMRTTSSFIHERHIQTSRMQKPSTLCSLKLLHSCCSHSTTLPLSSQDRSVLPVQKTKKKDFTSDDAATAPIVVSHSCVLYTHCLVNTHMGVQAHTQQCAIIDALPALINIHGALGPHMPSQKHSNPNSRYVLLTSNSL